MSHGPEPAAKLSLLDVIAQSVVFMGPVFSVSILLPLLVGPSARDRRLPASLARVSPRRGAPVGSTALIAVIYLGVEEQRYSH